MAPSEQAPFYAYAKAFAGRREKIITQMHFGAVYKGGKYGWTRNLNEIKEQFAWQLKLLNTDYTDIGFIHCVDDADDLNEVINGGLWDYMKELKKVAERTQLYRDCERMGVGISVMKPFAGGQLLDAKTSLFKRTLTHIQCFQYALDCPAVMTVLPGVRNMEDLKTALKYVTATPEEKDYSVIGEFTPQSAYGICVYCNHCQPCPMGLDVGLINKYYDLALAGDEMAKSHYYKLPVHAEACVKCGHCESRCPFHVKQESRMEEINTYFIK